MLDQTSSCWLLKKRFFSKKKVESSIPWVWPPPSKWEIIFFRWNFLLKMYVIAIILPSHQPVSSLGSLASSLAPGSSTRHSWAANGLGGSTAVAWRFRGEKKWSYNNEEIFWSTLSRGFVSEGFEYHIILYFRSLCKVPPLFSHSFSESECPLSPQPFWKHRNCQPELPTWFRGSISLSDHLPCKLPS